MDTLIIQIKYFYTIISTQWLHNPQLNQIMPFCSQMCTFAPSIHSSHIFLNSNVHLYPQTIQIRPFSTQICLSNLKPLKVGLFKSNVFLHLQTSQMRNKSTFSTSNHLKKIQQKCFCTLKSINHVFST